MEDKILTALWIVSFLFLLVSIIHKYLTWNFQFFLEQSILGPDPKLGFGNWWGIWNTKWHEVEMERYDKYGHIYGTFDGRIPNITIGDPKLLRKILISDFEYFMDRKPFQSNNKYLNNVLGTLTGSKWKNVRTSLSTCFSTGKIKLMSPLISESAVSVVEYLNAKLDDKARKVDIKSISVAYTLDVISNCGFGCKLDCLTNPSESTFVKFATNLFSSHKFNGPLFVLFHLYPNLSKFIQSNAFKHFDFFSNLAKKMLDARRTEMSLPSYKNRNDFLSIILEKSMDKDNELHNNEILQVAQSLQFLVAGFESSATVLSNLINCLALDEAVQDKLRDEIKQKIGSNDLNSIDSEVIGSMSYLQQCVSECLRIFPPAARFERLCIKTRVYESLRIPQGTYISVPVYAIHHDSKYYPNPELFDPERFTAEAIASRDSMTYIPFGEGPRTCIASRFALEEIKIAVCHLLLNFRFSRVYETADPPNFLSTPFPFLQTKKVIVGIDKLKK